LILHCHIEFVAQKYVRNARVAAKPFHKAICEDLGVYQKRIRSLDWYQMSFAYRNSTIV